MNLITELDIPQDILQLLNYNNIKDLKNQIKINGNEAGYETLMIISIYCNITISNIHRKKMNTEITTGLQ